MNTAAAETLDSSRRLARPRQRGGQIVRPSRRRTMARDTAPARHEARAISLHMFWDRHAVKTGIVAFWIWYVAANWHALRLLAHMG